MKERYDESKHLQSFAVRNQHFKTNRMDEHECKVYHIIMVSNWKLRVLNEQERYLKERQEARGS
jgi:hypothetical protein